MNRVWLALIDRGTCPHGAFAPNWCSECIAECTAEVEQRHEREELKEAASAVFVE
jgi:hypothetical protein